MEGEGEWEETAEGGEELPTYQDIKLAVQERRHFQKFRETAIRWAKIIVEEKNRPYCEKVVQPADVGGVAGGEKYIKDGILFKFACDWKNLYGLLVRFLCPIDELFQISEVANTETTFTAK